MTRLGRTLLLFEVGICFIPTALQLLVGLAMAPRQIFILMAAESEAKLGSLAFLLLISAGLCGLLALYTVMRWLLYGIESRLKPLTVICLMSIGLAPLVGFAPLAIYRFSLLGLFTILLPLLCSAHLVWLARDHLFGSFKWWRALNAT
jgi:hypothetical protein